MASTVWRGHLAFGLVSFPVRLYKAARAEKVSFRRLYRPAAPLEAPAPPPAIAEAPPPAIAPAPPPAIAPPLAVAGTGASRLNLDVHPTPPAPETEVFRTHNAVTAGGPEDQPVGRDQLVKGFEYEKGQYVVLEDEELKSIAPETSKEMQVVEFVRLAEIDPIYLETSYYVVPDEPGERPYALLHEALRQTGYVGLAQLAMHRREHVVILRPGRSGMIAHTMFYPDEVRGAQEYRPDTANIAPRELDLAKRLIESMVTPFEPGKFRDTYRERLEQIIAGKVAGRRAEHQPATERPAAAVIDILQALQESLKNVRKPPARSAGAQSADSGAVASRRRK